jgi:hypothetical protein
MHGEASSTLEDCDPAAFIPGSNPMAFRNISVLLPVCISEWR